MRTTSTDRMRKTRDRRRRSAISYLGEITREEIEFLARRGYDARFEDSASIGQAVSTFLADAVFDEARR